MNSFEDEHGFTLLEVVLSVAFFSLALGALFPMFSASPVRLEAMKDAHAAYAKAETILVQTETSVNLLSLAQGEAEAEWHDDDDGWQWRVFEVPSDGNATIDPENEVPGRQLTFRIHVAPSGSMAVLRSLDRTIWVSGGS